MRTYKIFIRRATRPHACYYIGIRAASLDEAISVTSANVRERNNGTCVHVIRTREYAMEELLCE